MKIAIMQPYFFPYIGYFQLVYAVDDFIFYDDVNFIKRGWINRNRILLNGKDHLLTVPCSRVSQNKLINEVAVNYGDLDALKLEKTLMHAYRQAPHFNIIMDLFSSVIDRRPSTISELAIESIRSVCAFLGIKTKFKIASQNAYNNKHLDKGDRLIDITKQEGFTNYMNAIGGTEIYTKEQFAHNGVNLEFLQPSLRPYNQGRMEFIPGLSILDILMFEKKETVIEHLSGYSLL